MPWMVWFSGLSTSLRTKGLLVQFPVRAYAWVVDLSCGPGPQLGVCERQLIDVCLAYQCFSPSFSPPSPPTKNKIFFKNKAELTY